MNGPTRERLIVGLTAAVCACAGALSLAWWFSYSAAAPVELRVELPSAAPAAAPPAAEPAVAIRGELQTFEGTPAALPGAWPRFRGPDCDNICRDGVLLAERWPAGGPPVLWSVELGEGYAGAAVLHGRVYLLDYDEEREGDALRCFSLADGREIWRRWYQVRVKRNHGMSRTVPAVTDRFVLTIGPRCHVMCVDAETGAFRWGMDLVREFGTKMPMWYTAQCPLLDGATAVLAPGGRSLMIGVDCETGGIVWETPNPRGWDMSHASVIPMEFGGRRMYVYCAIGGMAGVAADGDERGKVLWETEEWNHAVVAPSPVPLPDGRILVTAGYGAGSAMFRIGRAEGGFEVRKLFDLDRKVFACEQHTPILYDGYLYTVLPSDAGPVKEQLVCMDPAGQVLWRSGTEHRFGLGPFMVADGKLLVLGDDGELSLAQATPRGYAPLARADVLSGLEAWAPMALAAGRLLVRDRNRMVCLAMGAEKL